MSASASSYRSLKLFCWKCLSLVCGCKWHTKTGVLFTIDWVQHTLLLRELRQFNCLFRAYPACTEKRMQLTFHLRVWGMFNEHAALCQFFFFVFILFGIWKEIGYVYKNTLHIINELHRTISNRNGKWSSSIKTEN